MTSNMTLFAMLEGAKTLDNGTRRDVLSTRSASRLVSRVALIAGGRL